MYLVALASMCGRARELFAFEFVTAAVGCLLFTLVTGAPDVLVEVPLTLQLLSWALGASSVYPHWPFLLACQCL